MKPRSGRPRLGPFTALLVIGLLAACGKAVEPIASGDSGIEGTVLLGPTCPVIQEASPCPDRGVRAEISVTKADGAPDDKEGAMSEGGDVVAITSSGDDGRFRTTVPPGNYVLSANASGAMSCKPVEVTVQPHEFTKVTVTCDTGIR